jgi:hypothetical protein
MQTYMLFEYYAMYSCRDDLFPTAIRIHRQLVDAARQYQLLQDGVTLGGSDTGMDQSSTDGNGFPQNPFSISPEYGWRTFIENESRKRYVN